MTFLQREASAKHNQPGAAVEQPGPLEHMGRIAEKGILRLKGGSE
jgi:hypothetical protein